MSIAPHPNWVVLQMWVFPHVAMGLMPPLLVAGRARCWRLTVRQASALVLALAALIGAFCEGIVLALHDLVFTFRYCTFKELIDLWHGLYFPSVPLVLGISALLSWRLSRLVRRRHGGLPLKELTSPLDAERRFPA